MHLVFQSNIAFVSIMLSDVFLQSQKENNRKTQHMKTDVSIFKEFATKYLLKDLGHICSDCKCILLPVRLGSKTCIYLLLIIIDYLASLSQQII